VVPLKSRGYSTPPLERVWGGGGVRVPLVPPKITPMGMSTSWRRGVLVSGIRRMNEVNRRRARLVLRWVTVFGRIYRLGM